MIQIQKIFLTGRYKGEHIFIGIDYTHININVVTVHEYDSCSFNDPAAKVDNAIFREHGHVTTFKLPSLSLTMKAAGTYINELKYHNFKLD